jgi:hypothetical protein
MNETYSKNLKRINTMKKILPILLIFALFAGFAYAAPRVKIVMKGINPEMLKQSYFSADSSVTSGNHVIPKGNWAYVNCFNFGDAGTISSATWSFVSKPAGSNAVITGITGLNWWGKFKADVTGTYEVKVSIVASTGSKDTTEKIYASTYVGTGNFDGVPAVYPNCMSCHASMPTFSAIFDRWKVSGHAKFFKYNIDSGSASYGISCMKCHVVGYDHNNKADNNGFDDKAASLGWVWSNYSPPKKGNWDSLKNKYPALVAFAGIGCESCHGPGSEHAMTTDTLKINADVGAEKCGQCHGEPWRHSKFQQYENSMHSEIVWSSSFAQAPTNAEFGKNTLGNCIRCHDGQGYVNFTKGVGTNTNGMTQAQLQNVTCATCHDPHGNSNEYSLRNRPTGSDTLGNGYSYTNLGGSGKTCMDCHKARRNNVTYCATRVTSSTWGPHHNGQSDILLGQNAAAFTVPYMSGSHKNISNTCVTCHMAPTTDTGTVTRDKVGGHTWNLHDAASNYDHVAGCVGCHPGVTKFTDFMATADFDGNGQVQSWVQEVQGLEHALAWYLPPTGTDSVAWQLIAADSFNVNLRKAYWNWQLIEGDKSSGMHNPFYTVQVLQQSILALGYPIGVQINAGEVPKVFELSQNYPNPFNPSTQFKFSLPSKANVTIKIFDITGREIATLVNGDMVAGNYTANWDGRNSLSQQVSSGVYFYKMVAGSFVETKKMILVK